MTCHTSRSPGTLHFDPAPLRAHEIVLDQFIRVAGYLDGAVLAMGLHSAGEVHGVTPKIVDEFLMADDPGDHGAGVDPDPECKPPATEGVEGVFTQAGPLGDFSDQICCDALHGSFQDIVGCDR
jgi:hypothetical protein